MVPLKKQKTTLVPFTITNFQNNHTKDKTDIKKWECTEEGSVHFDVPPCFCFSSSEFFPFPLRTNTFYTVSSNRTGHYCTFKSIKFKIDLRYYSNIVFFFYKDIRVLVGLNTYNQFPRVLSGCLLLKPM